MTEYIETKQDYCPRCWPKIVNIVHDCSELTKCPECQGELILETFLIKKKET